MNAERIAFFALLITCASVTTAQAPVPPQPIELGKSYQSIETFCQDRSDALIVADAIEIASELQRKNVEAKDLPGPEAKFCGRALVTGTYVSREFTSRLVQSEMNVIIYRVDDARVMGTAGGSIYVIARRVPKE